MNRIEKLYYVIARNKQVEFRALIDLGHEKVKDKNKVVGYCKSFFPEVYKEAVKIVDNPERKILDIYEDDLIYFTDLLTNMKYENDELINLFNDYLDSRDLRTDFKNYLESVEKDEVEKDYCMYANMEDHYRNFTE